MRPQAPPQFLGPHAAPTARPWIVGRAVNGYPHGGKDPSPARKDKRR